jgi:hypothetical protein
LQFKVFLKSNKPFKIEYHEDLCNQVATREVLHMLTGRKITIW